MRKLIYIVLLALMPWWMLSCEKERYVDEERVSLKFSVDTLSFDTVFTTQGTATRYVKVYNRTANDIELSSITLKHGRQSRFRLNVDGDTSMVARRVELQSGDSIFIFVQACINPNSALEPFICTDSIVFSNGQYLPLAAWGRNAYYHKRGAQDSAWYVPIDCVNFAHDRPHVFLEPAAVLEGNTLTLTAGDELYFANDAMLVIDSAARLVANGSEDEPVLFSSVRHDGWYSFMPGQWQTIWFYNFSTGNVMNHCVVEHAVGGLRCYPGSELSVSNSIIRGMSDAGIIGQDAKIDGNNLLIYDCYTMLALISGGEYTFKGSTMAGYWNYRGSTRDTTGVIISNYYPVVDGIVGADMRKADFTDCIIYGSYPREVSVNSMAPFAMNYSFTHCLIKGGEWDEDPMFEDIGEDDYRLKEGSPATGVGYSFK